MKELTVTVCVVARDSLLLIDELAKVLHLLFGQEALRCLLGASEVEHLPEEAAVHVDYPAQALHALGWLTLPELTSQDQHGGVNYFRLQLIRHPYARAVF